MKARDLRKLLDGVHDDTPIMVPGPDHSYREAHCQITTGLKEGRNQWTEDYGEETTPEAEYGQRLPILLVEA